MQRDQKVLYGIACSEFSLQQGHSTSICTRKWRKGMNSTVPEKITNGFSIWQSVWSKSWSENFWVPRGTYASRLNIIHGKKWYLSRDLSWWGQKTSRYLEVECSRKWVKSHNTFAVSRNSTHISRTGQVGETSERYRRTVWDRPGNGSVDFDGGSWAFLLPLWTHSSVDTFSKISRAPCFASTQRTHS